ncbi:DUF3488 domain-containing protein [Chloracidobacterium validum]|uniref:DUF3488 domain-containing protein n=1 Tax=Chloracidobacterium validum TaxID=2821543 RepID=A0ABX8B6R1_9BACT|nr:DUF3488 and transglutaminase-like domain-containing protein [Chloracidobacterium validum]QUW02651.1 DUF3488 domain-containing protein [Chloracidobacterium validum]
MTIEKFFKATSYALVAGGFLTLALTGRVDTVTFILYALALVASWFADRPGSKLQISERVANWCVVGYLPFAYLDFRYLSGSWITPLIHFVLFVSIFKLFQVKRDRDWVFLYLLAVFEMLLAAGLTIDALFLVLLAGFTLTGLAALQAFEVVRTRRNAQPVIRAVTLSYDGQRARKESRPVRYLLAMTFAMAVLIGVLSTPMFFILPRWNTGLLAQSFSEDTAMTGFSDLSISLGSVGSIKTDERTAMRVRVDGPLSPDRHWRGMVMTQFDGREWTRPEAQQRMAIGQRAGKYVLDERRPGPLTTQVFYVEPMTTGALFHSGEPWFAYNIRGLARDAVGTFYRAERGTRLSYTVETSLSEVPAARLRQDPLQYDARTRETFLQLPPAFDTRITQLAREVATAATNGYDQARAIEAYLKTRYVYTLDLQRGSEPDPIVDFLFETRRGHCEYFASAMALMCRSLGLATRLAGGYHLGEYNHVNQTYIVRQADAHAWVEVYFPQTGTWVEFDPTPSVAGARANTADWLAATRRYIEALRMFYIDYVVAYDAQRQRALARDAGSATAQYQTAVQKYVDGYRRYFANWLIVYCGDWLYDLRWYYDLKGKIILGLVVTGTGLLLLGGYLLWRRLRQAPRLLFERWWLGWLVPLMRWRLRHDERQSAVLFYDEMAALLRRAGYRRAAHQTPLEFAHAIGFHEALVITQAYNQARYGPSLAVDMAQVDGALRTLRQRLRRQR